MRTYLNTVYTVEFLQWTTYSNFMFNLFAKRYFPDLPNNKFMFESILKRNQANASYAWKHLHANMISRLNWESKQKRNHINASYAIKCSNNLPLWRFTRESTLERNDFSVSFARKWAWLGFYWVAPNVTIFFVVIPGTEGIQTRLLPTCGNDPTIFYNFLKF